MGLTDLIRRRTTTPEPTRSSPALSMASWAEMLNAFTYQGVRYTLPGDRQEGIGDAFASIAQQAYRSNGVVFACEITRLLLFSEARFQFRQRNNGRPGKLFGTQELGVLERPWANATTGDLLNRMLLHADLGGNAYVVRRPGNVLRCLRPDWVDIVLGSDSDPDVAAWDVDADVLGYVYYPGGRTSGRPSMAFLPSEVAHFAPIPDPLARYRGMSWITPIVREVMGDKAATEHKLKFFENGATPNMVVKLDVEDMDRWKGWVEKFREAYEGSENAYKTLFLNSGADAEVVGANMQQLEFKVTQGAGETRIAAAAGVPPVIVGLSEGLQAATYSNYGQARRRLADGTMRPLWRNVAGSLASIVPVPAGAELWYDDRDIPFLQEDQKDAADIMQVQATAVKTFVDAGYTPDSAIAAVTANDINLLQHSGLVSVQLQAPGSSPSTSPAIAAP